MKELELKVEGMVCSGCENRVKNAISIIDGVETVEANHETGIVKVVARNNIEQTIIEEKIKEIGFDVI